MMGEVKEDKKRVDESGAGEGDGGSKKLPRTFANRERPAGADLQYLWDELYQRWPVLKETMADAAVNQVVLWNEVRDHFLKEEGSQEDKLNHALTKFASDHGCSLQFAHF